MLHRVVLILFSICCCCSSVFGEKNFWNNDICTTDSDCTGLRSCDLTFGCTLSGAKVGLVMIVVFLTLCAILVAIAYLCRRSFRTTRFVHPHNQYSTQTVITTNPWNQHHQMGTTTATVYPHNPYPNQFYANSVNPPTYSQYQADPRMNFNQVPTAPPGYSYGHAAYPQTYTN